MVAAADKQSCKTADNLRFKAGHSSVAMQAMRGSMAWAIPPSTTVTVARAFSAWAET